MRLISITGLLLFIQSTVALAHGLEITTTRHPSAIIIRAGYSEFEPAAHATVSIQTLESEHIFQTGNTDRNGFFAFIPDRAGTWQLIVDDQTGHRKKIEIIVSQQWITKQSSISSANKQTCKLPLLYKAILALSIFWGFTGLFHRHKTRKIDSNSSK